MSLDHGSDGLVEGEDRRGGGLLVPTHHSGEPDDVHHEDRSELAATAWGLSHAASLQKSRQRTADDKEGGLADG